MRTAKFVTHWLRVRSIVTIGDLLRCIHLVSQVQIETNYSELEPGPALFLPQNETNSLLMQTPESVNSSRHDKFVCHGTTALYNGRCPKKQISGKSLTFKLSNSTRKICSSFKSCVRTFDTWSLKKVAKNCLFGSFSL